MRALILATVVLALLGGCEETTAPIGPPHCEPTEEILIERALKDGFRAAAEGELDAADQAFDEALKMASEHPQALAGKRLVEDIRRGRKNARRGAP